MIIFLANLTFIFILLIPLEGAPPIVVVVGTPVVVAAAAAQSRIGEREKVLKFPSVLFGCCQSGEKRTQQSEDGRKEDAFRDSSVGLHDS